MAYLPYSPSALRALAESIELPAKAIREIADSMESQGVDFIELQIKTISYRYIDPLSEWVEDLKFDAAKKIRRAAKEKTFREGGEAVRAHLDAEKAETPKPKAKRKGGGK